MQISSGAVKPYGVLDGLLAGLAAGLLIIAAVVAAHDYEWLAWGVFSAALVVAAAVAFAVKRGRGLVDGVILQPWLRHLLLAVVVIELAGISIGPFFGPRSNEKNNEKSAASASVTNLVTESCDRLIADLVALEQLAESRKEGTASDALRSHASLRNDGNRCDAAFKSRLAAVWDRLVAWNNDSKETRIDVASLNAQLDKLPPPMIETPSPRPGAGPDRTPFTPDFAYVPPALIPAPPSPTAGVPAKVTVDERRRSILLEILRLLPGGFSFGGTRITTTTIMGEIMQSKDDRGRAVLQAMADSIPKERPDRLSKLWLQLRILANEPVTPEDQRQMINDFLGAQGPVPTLCDWILLSVKDQIGEEVAARIKIDGSRVDDFIRRPSSDRWPKVYEDVEKCVFERDKNHFAAYGPALENLRSMRLRLIEQ